MIVNVIQSIALHKRELVGVHGIGRLDPNKHLEDVFDLPSRNASRRPYPPEAIAEILDRRFAFPQSLQSHPLMIGRGPREGEGCDASDLASYETADLVRS